MKTLFCLLFTFSTIHALAQEAMSIEEARSAKTINVKLLDSLYVSGAHIDTSKAAFPDKQEEYINSYNNLRKDLGDFLHKNNFHFGKTTKCMNKVYFNKDGTIKYFLYGFREIEPSKEAEFKRLLNLFIKNYTFPMKCNVDFRQCGPTTYNE